MTRLTRSRSAVLVGEQAPPRVAVAPAPTRANAWEDVADLSRSFGVELDQWQEVVLQAAMGERSDGTWAAKQVGLSAPRQNGKSQLIVARALAGALLFGEKKIVISAHSQDTARETFGKFIEQIDNSSALAERVDKVMNALNREYIKFKNGATIQFKARTVSGSRGFSSDCLMLDEAQILGMPAWVSINSTMSARPNPQIWLLGTPPTPEDNGEVFTSIRTSAIDGRSRTLAWQEWSATPGDDPAADETRAKANPAWNTRINHEVVQGEYETYPPERFALDRLGIWNGDQTSALLANWGACAAAADQLPDRPEALGLAVSIDQQWASIAAVGAVDDKPFLGAAAPRMAGTADLVDTLVAELARMQSAHGMIPVAIDKRGPAAYLIPTLEDADIALEIVDTADYLSACSELFDSVARGDLLHGDHPDLNAAVKHATKRTVGDRWAWARKNGDISMLEAATLARWAANAKRAYDVLDSVF